MKLVLGKVFRGILLHPQLEVKLTIADEGENGDIRQCVMLVKFGALRFRLRQLFRKPRGQHLVAYYQALFGYGVGLLEAI